MDNMLEFAKKAYNNIPMYARKYEVKEDVTFEDFPLIEKNYVISQESGAIAPDAIMLYYHDKLLKCRTSGSTGKYMEIYWKKSDYMKSMLPLWKLRKEYYGICPNDKMCYFYTLTSIGDNEVDIKYDKNTRGYSKSNLSMDKLKEIYLDMLEYEPKWLLLQPSMAILLCQCVEKFDLPIMKSVRYIEMSGEILSDKVRKWTKRVFANCTIANQYGANEFNSIAYECPYGNMHINTSNVYVECINGNDDEKEGLLYITSKTNTAMPLIRYGIGDRGYIDCDTICKCGKKRPILNLTSGRANDIIITSSGERKTAYVLVRAIDCVNYMYEGIIKQFQIVQNSVEDFIVKLVVDDEEYFDKNEMERILVQNIKDEEVRNSRFTFEYYEEMFPDVVSEGGISSSGKFAYFRRMFE